MRKLPDRASQRKRNPPGGSHIPLAWHVQFRPELYGPATSQTAVCSESQQDRWSSKRVRRSTSRHGDNTPSATYCSPRSYAISSMAFCGLSDFGAPHAKEPFRLARNAAGTTLRLARGVSDECAVVVDLPLATPACQNVFGPSETPVFVSCGGHECIAATSGRVWRIQGDERLGDGYILQCAFCTSQFASLPEP
jgi:hypothetical protein